MKNKLVKISVLLIALAVVLACLFACGSDSGDNSDGGKEPTEPTTAPSTGDSTGSSGNPDTPGTTDSSSNPDNPGTTDSSSNPDNPGTTESSGNVNNPGSTPSSGGTVDSDKQTVTVTFVLQGGSCSYGELTVKVEKGNVIGVLDIPDVYRDGYTFLGWAYDSEGYSIWSQSDSFLFDTELFAIWKSDGTTDPSQGTTDPSQGTTDPSQGTTDPSQGTTDPSDDNIDDIEQVAVTFNTQGGTLVSGSTIIWVEKGGFATAPTVTRAGYLFVCWAYDPEGNIPWSEAENFITDTELFAVWEVDESYDPDNPGDTTDPDDPPPEVDPSVSYTVTFDTSRATDKVTVESQTVYLNGKVVAPSHTPYRKGSVFYGWCIDGDKSKIWDFTNDYVTGDIKLVAVFTATGGSATCEHEWTVTEDIKPTCEMAGRIVRKCNKCKLIDRITKDKDPSLARLEHLELTETVAPGCATEGYTTVYCPNGCGLTKTTILKATGNHTYDEINGWIPTLQATMYVSGRYENPCLECGGAAQVREELYNAEDEQLYDEKVNISYKYTGGKYTNEAFVNVATLGKVLVSSYFDGTKGNLANDGNPNTFWNADTYVDGAKYTSDWLELELSAAYDVGAIKFVVPNYSAWELGDDCYVSYDVEYWDEATGKWVFISSISDKNATPAGISCEISIVLPSPVNTNKIRASVTNASRYAPAVIYEVEAYVKVDELERKPVSISEQATVSVSGKYNEWASGGDALKDGTTGTYWYTDRRVNETPWAIYEFASERYIACIQFAMSADRGRTFLLEIYQNGAWKEIGTYSVPSAGELGGNVISNQKGMCIFNIDIEEMASKFRFTLTKDPVYWESKIFEITPYSIVELPFGEPGATGCTHANPLKGEVVPATCDTPGYTTMNCICGAVLRTKSTDVLGHDWGKYTVKTAATATAVGIKEATCRNGCGATSTKNYELNYNDVVIMDYFHGAPAAWAQTYDDGNYLETYEWSNEHLIKYGARATVMMSICYSDALVSIWQSHFTKGVYDLGSHSYNHTNIYAGPASSGGLIAEVVNAQYWFRHNFKNQPLITFAAPLGATSDSVAEFLAGTMAANRNGGGTGSFYNTPDELTSRLVWGDLNSYISKADQTEGKYVFVKIGDTSGAAYVQGTLAEGEEGTLYYNGEVSYLYTESYENAAVNLVFDWDEMKFVDKGTESGTYKYVPEDFRYDYCETGSYALVDNKFVFTEDGSGEYKLVKTTYGSYEKGVEQLVAAGGFTVECLHSVGFGSIYSSYDSTISKLEHIARFGVWAPSYNELIQYLKEAQSAKVNIVDRNDTTVKISVTDSLDDYMFDQAITIKVDIPDGWTSVTATQGGVNIPFLALSEYKKTKNMTSAYCTIEDGYLLIDVVPDAGEVVVTVGDTNGAPDYEEKVTVSFEPGEGTLNSDEYEERVVVGGAVTAFPTPERYGYKFIGWYKDEGCTEAALLSDTYSTDATLYAKWEEIPTCTDGTYDHKWGGWAPATDNVNEVRVCSKCQAEEKRAIEE